MNYSIPVIRSKISNEAFEVLKDQVDAILDQQILISQLSTAITFEDTNNMDEYERCYILQKLFQMKKEEIEAKQRAYENARKK